MNLQDSCKISKIFASRKSGNEILTTRQSLLHLRILHGIFDRVCKVGPLHGLLMLALWPLTSHHNAGQDLMITSVYVFTKRFVP